MYHGRVAVVLNDLSSPVALFLAPTIVNLPETTITDYLYWSQSLQLSTALDYR